MPQLMAGRVSVETRGLRLADGTTLNADVYHTPALGPQPTLLLRTPYSRAESAARIDAIRLARSGWLVVVQNVRGTGDSTGCLDPFAQEESDGIASIEWCQTLPGCDGRVAMTGSSYEGMTQWFTARGRPGGLRAIYPRLCARSIRDVWFRNGGILRQAFIQSWTLGLLYNAPHLTSQDHVAIQGLADMRGTLYEFPPSLSPLTRWAPYYARWIEDGDTPYWKDLDLSGDHFSDVVVMQVTGWYDIFCEGALADHAALTRSRDTRRSAPRRLIVGPWSHTSLPDQVTGTEDHGLAANGIAADIVFEGHRWLRSALDGDECENYENTVRVFIVGGRQWVDLPGWPPPHRTELLQLIWLETFKRQYASGVHRLRGEEARVRPDGGRILDPLQLRSGPFTVTEEFATRADVAALATEPFSENVTLIGEFALDLCVLDANGVDRVVAMLAVVGRDNRWVAHAECGLDLRNSGNEVTRFPFVSMGLRVRRGERLGVLLCLSYFPAYWEGEPNGDGTPYPDRWLDLDRHAVLRVPVLDPPFAIGD